MSAGGRNLARPLACGRPPNRDRYRGSSGAPLERCGRAPGAGRRDSLGNVSRRRARARARRGRQEHLAFGETSGVSDSPGDVGPQTREAGLEADHLSLIDEARDLIFIETQFLRSPRIGRALARKGESASAPGMIVVLPAAPEDVAFEGSGALDARYGEYLQARQLLLIRRAFGDRAAFLSPARAARRDARDRSALKGAGIIYVHGKALIVIDCAAIVSSANLNGRSMR